MWQTGSAIRGSNTHFVLRCEEHGKKSVDEHLRMKLQLLFLSWYKRSHKEWVISGYFPFVFSSLLLLSDLMAATSEPTHFNPTISVKDLSTLRFTVQFLSLFRRKLIHAVDWQAPRHRIMLQVSYGCGWASEPNDWRCSIITIWTYNNWTYCKMSCCAFWQVACRVAKKSCIFRIQCGKISEKLSIDRAFSV